MRYDVVDDVIRLSDSTAMLKALPRRPRTQRIGKQTRPVANCANSYMRLPPSLVLILFTVMTKASPPGIISGDVNSPVAMTTASDGGVIVVAAWPGCTYMIVRYVRVKIIIYMKKHIVTLLLHARIILANVKQFLAYNN